MHGEEGVVELGVDERKRERIADASVRHHLGGGKRKLPTQQEGQRTPDEEKSQRAEKVLEADGFVVERPDVFLPAGGFVVVVVTVGFGMREGGGAHGLAPSIGWRRRRCQRKSSGKWWRQELSPWPRLGNRHLARWQASRTSCNGLGRRADCRRVGSFRRNPP